jgi:hypothetical protein
MPGYTKLFSSIITSTIWREPPVICKVWITMLALADKNGEVTATIPGLADMARVSRDDCEAALKIFLSPDPDSRSEDSEGRRIEQIDGGWELINHAKYRKMTDLEDQKTMAALRSKRYRERHAAVTLRHAPSRSVTNSHGKAEAEAEANRQLPSPPKAAADAPVPKNPTANSKQQQPPSPAESVYRLYPRKAGHLAAIKAISAALKIKGLDALKEATAAYAGAVARWPAADRQFIPHPATWFNQGRYDDDRLTWQRNGGRAPPSRISEPEKPDWKDEMLKSEAVKMQKIISENNRRESHGEDVKKCEIGTTCNQCDNVLCLLRRALPDKIKPTEIPT